MQRLKRRWRSQAFLQASLGISLATLIVVLFAIDLHQRYDAAIDRGKTDAQNFAEILSEHTALTFENVERSLLEAMEIRKDSLKGDYASPQEVNAALHLLMKTSPIVVAVGWTDATGKLLAHSYERNPPRHSIAEMAHFKAHRDTASDRLYVSPPFRSADSGKWLIATSLRLSHEDGSFAGVVSAPLDRSNFAKIYRSINLGTEGSVLLMHTNGQVLAREPYLEELMGKSFAGVPLLTKHLPRSDAGSYEAIGVVDGRPRIAGYKAVRGLPLVQLVTYARADVLQPWYRHVMLFGPLAAIFVAAILIGTFLIVRQTRRLAQRSDALLEKTRELERTNALFDMALSEMPNGLVVWDADQRISIANSRYREMFDLSPEQVAPGVSLRQLLQTYLDKGESSELNMDKYIEAVLTQTEQVGVLADGRTIVMRRHRMPDGGWIATHQDISELKRAENLLRTTLDTMDQGLIAVDRDGRIALMNARVLDLLGLPQKFAAGHPHKDEILEYQRSIGEFSSDEQYAQVVKDIDERRHAIYERKRPNGTVLEVRTVPTEDGGFVRTYTDVTASRATEAALRLERDRAEAAVRAKADFLSNMSHELRTPLTAIIGVADMLLTNAHPPAKQRNYLEMQRSAGEGLLCIVNDILDFSKIEAGQLSLNTAPLSLSRLAKQCLELVSDQAQRKGLELTSSIAADLPEWVSGDEVRLRQILLNFLGNAVKFTPSGLVRLTIDKIPGTSGDFRLAVADTGIGISYRDLPSLFQRFVQADNSTTRRFGGTGLGLAISKQLVTLMGGRIDVRSTPGRGTEFSFVIELPPSEETPSDLSAAPPMHRTPYRLLLAEDNELSRDLVKAMLEQAGHEVVAVNDGAEAVRMAVRRSFDAILMDVQMPEMDGYAAARTIRAAIKVRPRLPIIALTANALPGESERCLEAGMNAHVPKPVNWPSLFETIDRLVRQEGSRESSQPAVTPANPGLSSRSTAFDEAIFAQLQKSIGDANAGKLLRLFCVEARQRFLTQPVTAEERDAIGREAHTLAGAAGMLGFHALAEACSNLEFARQDVFEVCLGRCREARDAALQVVAELLANEGSTQKNDRLSQA